MPVYSGEVGATGGNYDATFDGHGSDAWTDLNPNSFFKDPNILVDSADVTRYKEDQDIWDLFRRPREVIYTEVHTDTGTNVSTTYKYRLSLTFMVMPAGATSLTIGGTGGAASGTIGRCIGNDGVLATASDTHSTVAGFSLGKYFSVGVDSFGEAAIGEYATSSLASDAFVVTTLTAGDGIWVVRSGRLPVDVTTTVAVGGPLTFGAAGEVAPVGYTGSLAGIRDLASDGLLGIALSSGTDTGEVKALADIQMPERLGDTVEGSHIPDASPVA